MVFRRNGVSVVEPRRSQCKNTDLYHIVNVSQLWRYYLIFNEYNGVVVFINFPPVFRSAKFFGRLGAINEQGPGYMIFVQEGEKRRIALASFGGDRLFEQPVEI